MELIADTPFNDSSMQTVGNNQNDGPMDLDPPNPSHNDGDDPMDLDNHSNKRTGSALRRQSLFLATFPWFSTIIMTPKKLSDELGNDHYAHVCFYSIFPVSLSINELYY